MVPRPTGQSDRPSAIRLRQFAPILSPSNHPLPIGTYPSPAPDDCRSGDLGCLSRKGAGVDEGEKTSLSQPGFLSYGLLLQQLARVAQVTHDGAAWKGRVLAKIRKRRGGGDVGIWLCPLYQFLLTTNSPNWQT